MRSRYSAFVLEDDGYLLGPPGIRRIAPHKLAFRPGLKWLGLEVRSHRQIDAAPLPEVEFVARSRLAPAGPAPA